MVSGNWAFLVAGVPLLVLPIALQSVPAAIACAVVLTVTISISVIGSAATGRGVLLLAFGTAPLNLLQPLPELELSDCFFAAGFFLLIPQLLATRIHLPKAILIGALGILTIGPLSALASGQTSVDFYRLMQVVPGVVLLPILIAWWRPGHRATVAAAGAYLLGNTVSVAACFFQDAPPGGRYAGLTEQPNYFGVALAVGLALVPFLLQAVPPRYRWIVVFAAVSSGYGIWISGSRAGLVCAVAVLVLYPLLQRSIPVALFTATLYFPAILLFTAASPGAGATNALGRLLGGGTSRFADEQRAAARQAGIEEFLAHPILGAGWSWWIHNGYVQVAAAMGILGLASYLLILAALLRPLATEPLPYRLLALPALAVALISASDPWVGGRHIWCMAALALTAHHLAMASEHQLQQTGQGARRRSRQDQQVLPHRYSSAGQSRARGVFPT